MTSYTATLDHLGMGRLDQIRRDDGAFVSTGTMVDGTPLPTDDLDADAKAFQAWLAAGGKVGPAVPDLRAYAAAALASKLAAGETFNVAASGQAAVPILCDGTNATRADLALLALFGQANPTGAKTWLDNAGVATTLSGAQLVTLSTLAGTWISDRYPALASILAGVASGKVTTTAQVDAALAAVTA